MIPILYEAGTTEYKTNGLGRLKDAISCNVIEERNGTYELSMTYPISGIHYADIAIDRIIYAEPADGKSAQPFRIYKISRPMSGQVEISAEHISYLLSAAIVMPFKASNCIDAFSKLSQNIVGADEFTFSTDKTVTAEFVLDEPMDCRSLLGGTRGSILDTYGTGEYEFDGFDVKLHLHRGTDSGVTIRYGKNLTDATRTSDMSNVYTGIVPYATADDVTYTLPEKVVKSEHTGDFANPRYKVVDLSNKFSNDETPTEEKLRSYAEVYIKSNEGWEISDNVEVEFAALWQTDEYKDMAIQRINLCDTIHVVYTDLGINVTAEVIKTDYDVLAERYNSIEVGNSSTNLSKTITDAIDDATGDIKAEVSALPSAIKKATEQITGGLGGYIVLMRNANGQPEELLIMDTDDVNTAVNVWRWNKGGLGHSHNGYDGPFDDVAITQDGAIVADYITTGTLSAVLINSLTQIGDVHNYWNLANGTFCFGDNSTHILYDGNLLEIVSDKLHSTDGAGNSVTIEGATVESEDSRGNKYNLTGAAMQLIKSDGSYAYLTTDSVGFYSSTGLAEGYYGRSSLRFTKTGHGNWTGKGVYIDEKGISFGQADGWNGVPILRAYQYGDADYVEVTSLRFIRSDGGSAGTIDWESSEGNRWIGSNTNFYCAGHVKCNDVIEFSDRRSKQDIEDIPLDESSKLILGLKPKHYRFIEDTETLHHGFIAQDVEEVLSDDAIVRINAQGNYGLVYAELIPDMVNVIQSQHKRITDLEERLAKIEEALNADN